VLRPELEAVDLYAAKYVVAITEVREAEARGVQLPLVGGLLLCLPGRRLGLCHSPGGGAGRRDGGEQSAPPVGQIASQCRVGASF
jgi:hypothetical protein